MPHSNIIRFDYSNANSPQIEPHSLQYVINLDGNGSESIRLLSTCFCITKRHIFCNVDISPK